VDPSGGVLVLLDGSETSERALDLAIERALERRLPVTCLAVVPPRLWRAKQGQFQMAPETHDELFAADLVAMARDRCEKHGVDARTLVRCGALAAIIVEEAREGYALVVLGERRSLTGAPSLASIVRDRLAVPVDVVAER
jgi:nucleotide-binding universal stress UspA family protein